MNFTLKSSGMVDRFGGQWNIYEAPSGKGKPSGCGVLSDVSALIGAQEVHLNACLAFGCIEWCYIRSKFAIQGAYFRLLLLAV